MSRRAHDPPPLPPPLERLGSQFREREQAEDRARAVTARRWRPVSAGAVAIAAIVAFVLFGTGGAGALDVINRAPAAAARSDSVRFQSAISIRAGSEPALSFTQVGAIDFASRAYSTTLELGQGQAIEQRRVADVFYTAQINRGAGHGRVRWLAIPVAHEAANTFASAPESEEFTSPLVLLDELGGTRAPVVNEGPERLHGVPTTRYHLETNLASLLSTSPGAGAQPAIYRSVVVSLTVWLDRLGRPRQVDESLTGSPATGPVSITTLTTFTSYGLPVAVRAPSPIFARSKRSINAPNPLAALPTRLFKQRLFAHP